MTQQHLEINPVTRIEGAMKVSIYLDSAGDVERASANVLEYRGFEAFLRGRLVEKMPLITPRICGVCPVPHHLASLKAIENGLGVEPPESAQLVRELMLVAEHVSDHMLQMFVMAGSDFLLADAPPEQRGLGSLYERYPEVVQEVFQVRSVTQSLLSALGVQAVHPATGVPGGVTRTLSEEQRRRYLRGVQQGKARILKFHDEVLVPNMEATAQKYSGMGQLQTHFIGLVDEGRMIIYDGQARVIDPTGQVVAEFPAEHYSRHIGEKTVEHSYAKAAYWRGTGNQEELLRAGPIARVNAADRITTEYAERYRQEFEEIFGAPAQQTLALNIARYISTVYAIERAEQILADARLSSSELRTPVTVQAGKGAGMVEAPRGLLIHQYEWDEAGYVQMANIITPTNANAYAFDHSLGAVARRSIQGGVVERGRLEHEIGMTIRAYDPCLSCATHAITGKPEIEIEIVNG